ncbi:uncharacterized protein LOC121738084 isoform X1 [Aricia agestis]|uniref:uncharacterized protein LOC121738084 isoform X1 n=1 Tax=Aricia agestis TaxID=91739 RepID=UPI001C2035FE|nr:uncharacterized protein LOC121738084 isoform X1 [Aricia agestis]
MEGSRKNVRCTALQLKILVDYMIENPVFASGECTGLSSAKKLEEEWTTLAATLSEHGPDKTIQQWKVTWRDLKKKARADGLRVLQAYNDGVGKTDSILTLSDQSLKVLKAIGHEAAERIEMVIAESGTSAYPIQTTLVPSLSAVAATESNNLTTTQIFKNETCDSEQERVPRKRRRSEERVKEKEKNSIDKERNVKKETEKNKNALELRTGRDEFDIFGEHVAMKIRNLNNSNAKHKTQYLINNILYNAAMGEYDSNNDPLSFSESSSQVVRLSSREMFVKIKHE